MIDHEAMARELAFKAFEISADVDRIEDAILAALQSAHAAGYAEGDRAGYERGVRDAARVAGTMAERPYDVEPEFSAVLAVESAILALLPAQPKEPT